MNEFIIVFRESLEACLIIGIIYILLEKNNLKKELRQVWLGVFSAIVASIIVAISLNYIKACQIFTLETIYIKGIKFI